ncbi:MAG: YdcF family protein [Candidatus Magasanikbacteria bacterium]|nr:YdcF family protein [Candidatus Magasanikbacteria bacterium]
MKVYVNGYGAPKDPLCDGNLDRYLGQVLKYLEAYRDTNVDLFLVGGYTNRLDMSEAEAMKGWLMNRGLPSNVTIRLIDTTDTARDNMVEFKKRVGDVPVLIFCEFSRRPTMAFFAWKLFAEATVHGVRFDERSLRLAHRIKQLTTKLWLEQLAWHSKTIDVLRKWLRKRHVDRARAMS